MNKDFKIHQFRGHIQTNFVVEYKDKILILDGGSRSDTIRYKHFITKTLKRNISDVKLVVVSHIHPDHAGGVQALRKKYNIPIAAYYKIDNWYAGVGGRIQHIVDMLMAWYVAIRIKSKYKRFWYSPKVKPNYKLKNSNKLPFFDDWEVIYNPGHTLHDISLYNKKYKIIYVGDLIVIVNKKCVLPFPITIPSMIEESLNHLATLDIDKIYMAHGSECDNNKEKNVFKSLVADIGIKPQGIFKVLKLISSFSPYLRKIRRRIAYEKIK